MNMAGNNTVESLGKNTIENSESLALSTNLYVAIEAMGAMLNIIWKNIVCLIILPDYQITIGKQAAETNGIAVDTLCWLSLPGNRRGATRTKLHNNACCHCELISMARPRQLGRGGAHGN